MANHGCASRLPLEVSLQQQAIPTSAAAVTATDTDLIALRITNATAGAINLTITNAADNPVSGFNEIPIDPDTPYNFEFNTAPLRLVGGMKWVASGAGLVAEVAAWRHPEFTVV